jgi:tetratricopeptide (TPR) repeat protein
MGDHQAAAELCEESLSRLREAGDRLGEYDALYLSAHLKLYQGDLATGRERLEQARALDLDTVPANTQARMLYLLAFYSRELGEYDAAIRYSRESLRVGSDLGPAVRARTWLVLGGTLQLLGRHDEAIDAHSIAFRCHMEAGDRAGQSLGINHIGVSLRQLGRVDEALDRHREALTIAREVRYRNAQLEAHRALGVALRESGQVDEAMHHLEHALELAGELDQPIDTARAHDELARTHARNDAGRAREHWREALALFEQLGVPEAERVREQLAALDGSSDG